MEEFSEFHADYASEGPSLSRHHGVSGFGFAYARVHVIFFGFLGTATSSPFRPALIFSSPVEMRVSKAKELIGWLCENKLLMPFLAGGSRAPPYCCRCGILRQVPGFYLTGGRWQPISSCLFVLIHLDERHTLLFFSLFIRSTSYHHFELNSYHRHTSWCLYRISFSFHHAFIWAPWR